MYSGGFVMSGGRLILIISAIVAGCSQSAKEYDGFQGIRFGTVATESEFAKNHCAAEFIPDPNPCNHFNIMSRDYDPKTKRLYGLRLRRRANVPQPSNGVSYGEFLAQVEVVCKYVEKTYDVDLSEPKLIKSEQACVSDRDAAKKRERESMKTGQRISVENKIVEIAPIEKRGLRIAINGFEFSNGEKVIELRLERVALIPK